MFLGYRSEGPWLTTVGKLSELLGVSHTPKMFTQDLTGQLAGRSSLDPRLGDDVGEPFQFWSNSPINQGISNGRVNLLIFL